MGKMLIPKSYAQRFALGFRVSSMLFQFSELDRTVLQFLEVYFLWGKFIVLCRLQRFQR
jgi:hypothetical protein